MTIVAAADGSALGNPGPAGWAWYVDDSCWRAGGWPHGTNNQGELMAVLDLFRSTEHVADQHLRILCDSQYVINCVTKWMQGWKRKGWRKADGKPVLNVELLQGIDAAIKGRDYSFEWVKGHAGHDLNEAADERARAVATAYQKGTAAPEGPGFPGMAAVAPAGRAAASGSRGAGLITAGPGTGGGWADAEEEPDLFSSLFEEDFETEGVSVADQIVALERELLDPAVRADASRVAVLLDTDFEEFGVSGRMWTRDAMLASLAEEASADVSLDVLNVDVLDDVTALLTYRTVGRAGSALRSSLWRRSAGQWRLRFHQGTPEV
jgi:ribonuclease HI